jgi:molecular chaperone DnaK (HSP70)
VIRTPFLVGIDLGTTNCAVAYVDTRGAAADSAPRVRRFSVPQLVAAREVAALSILPSFLYFATEGEREAGAAALPWDGDGSMAVGAFARDHGALMPSRQVASAKSWLAHGGVDRTAPILPFGHEVGEPGISPVDASARYLSHIRDAWNHTVARGDDTLALQSQQVVLTVPASFDEEARELTAEAASRAGLAHVVLIEEPAAALYAWISRHPGHALDRIREGALVLVCDVGGGTTDFSLVRATGADADRGFERLAIGEHLLLGGDNLDLALAVSVESRLAPGARLSLARREGLRRQCALAKEQLLAEGGPESVRITVLGGGGSLVGGSAVADLTRAEVHERLLAGFLPLVDRTERPARDRRRGLRELGLPYEPDAAITRHLAAFLDGQNGEAAGDLARPDAVLFNGGFFTPALARERVGQALAGWFDRAPDVLANEHPESAVAVGAAYYAALRTLPGGDPRLLVRAGSARTYYIALDDAPPVPGLLRVITVMPRGTGEGARLESSGRRFRVTTNRPIGFTLYSSTTREDAHGSILDLDPETLHRHAPLTAVLRYGKRSQHAEVTVALSVVFTELGALELWLDAPETGHRWRLQFQVRAPAPTDEEGDDSAAADDAVVVADEAREEGVRLIQDVFGENATAGGSGRIETLVADIEAVLGYGKQVWPIDVLRRFADELLDRAATRSRSAAHEARWLNLTGFCMRPGFGASADPWRIGEIRKVYTAGLSHPREVQAQVEWLVLWQRVAGGFSAGQQRELAQRLIASLGLGSQKAARLNPQIERESWRLLATLERIDLALRVRIGDALSVRVRKNPRDASLIWALGRTGARVPFVGPLDRVVPPDVAERWIGTLLSLRHFGPDAAGAVAQLAAATGDPARDITVSSRQQVIARLRELGGSADALVDEVEKGSAAPVGSRGLRYTGETLPQGLRLAE